MEDIADERDLSTRSIKGSDLPAHGRQPPQEVSAMRFPRLPRLGETRGRAVRPVTSAGEYVNSRRAIAGPACGRAQA